jgi:hypothetical protein
VDGAAAADEATQPYAPPKDDEPIGNTTSSDEVDERLAHHPGNVRVWALFFQRSHHLQPVDHISQGRGLHHQ